MEHLTIRQIAWFVIVLLCVGTLTAWGMVRFARDHLLVNPSDPLAKQGGLSPAQAVEKNK
jgi:hypothetical protein